MKLRVWRAESSAASVAGKPNRTKRRRRPSSMSAWRVCTRAHPSAMAAGANDPAASTTRASCTSPASPAVDADRAVAAFDGGPESAPQLGLDGHPVLEMGLPEGDVAGFVLQRQMGDPGRDRVGRVLVQEGEEVQEGAFAQHGEQELGEGEVGLIQERLQRRPATHRRPAHRTST